MTQALELDALARGLFLPLARLTLAIGLGLFAGNLIESMNWTRAVARLAQPLVNLGRLKDVAGASFSMAFFSGPAANTMLAEAFEQGRLGRRELVLSNLFNSLPTYFLHLPTVFFIAAPFLGAAAVVYVILTAAAAALRTLFVVLLGRLILPRPQKACVICLLDQVEKKNLSSALAETWKRFKARLPRIMLFTAPIYALFYLARALGLFEWIEGSAAGRLALFSWLPPEAMGVVALHMAAEFTAAAAAAAALLSAGALTAKEVVLALLLGNVLSTPMRAFRHQFPYYAGIFRPKTAALLMACNQALRAAGIILVGAAYLVWG
ncbi:MAG: hypothetical protein JW718_04965 [Desulfovibrionaceae bacterium]|nr:hypothetical protein [Desulfovibrionaceae bacterium]